MSSAIFDTIKEARQYRRYLRKHFKNTIIIVDNEMQNEIIYIATEAMHEDQPVHVERY